MSNVTAIYVNIILHALLVKLRFLRRKIPKRSPIKLFDCFCV